MKWLREWFKDDNFLGILGRVESIVSKVLSLAMLVVIIVAVYQLGAFLVQELFVVTTVNFGKKLFTVFGLFLNVLIALEILENITAYLKKHVIQVELVIVTSLIAVARKIIILDFEKTEGIELMALALAITSLSVSYWIIRKLGVKGNH